MHALAMRGRVNAVRFVARDKQHGSIEQELTEAFARLLRASGYTFGTEVEQFEAEELSLPMHPNLGADEVEHVAEAVITTEGASGARC